MWYALTFPCDSTSRPFFVEWEGSTPTQAWDLQSPSQTEKANAFMHRVIADDISIHHSSGVTLSEMIKLAEETNTPRPFMRLAGKKILLDPGHNEAFRGARGIAPDFPEEEDHARHMASRLANLLRREGATVRVYDPQDHDNLREIGGQAAGYDMFLSLHLNAYDNKDHYCATLIHATRNRAEDVAFAHICTKHMARHLNHRIYSGGGTLPDGVYPAALGVLTGAILARCPVAVLTEPFFIDAYGSDSEVEGRCHRAVDGIYDAIIEWFSSPRLLDIR